MQSFRSLVVQRTYETPYIRGISRKRCFLLFAYIAVPGRVRYTLIWEAIEINRLEQLTCTSCE